MSTGLNVDVAALHDTIATLGRSLGGETLEATRALYAPFHPDTPPQRVIRDLSYGTHERQVLDLHLPVTAPTTALPVLVFVHGGGFVGGDKGGPGRALHDNVGRFAVESGFVGATINYRFAPGHAFPAGAQDVAAAVAYLSGIVSEHGGDPTRIVAMGHSAGAAHVASCVADPEIATHASGLCAAVLSSGIYDPAALWGEVSTAYYGEDETAWPQMASRPGLCATSLPLMFIVAQHDPPDFHRQAVIVAHDYTEAHHHLPGFVIGIGHNHFSSPAHYGTVDDELSSQVARFVAEVTR
jgi:triacylglycerol lipase